MARELELAAVASISASLPGVTVHHNSPAWLMRPGGAECRERWGLVRSIYTELTGLDLPSLMPPRERRQVDAVIELPGHRPRLFEFDESQHFNAHRATTLRAYPDDLLTAFPKSKWLDASTTSTRKLGTSGGWGKVKPPLFPAPGGRHLQRAFRDALADILPEVHGWAPTLRIADFEVHEWIHGPDRDRMMRRLLRERLA